MDPMLEERGWRGQGRAGKEPRGEEMRESRGRPKGGGGSKERGETDRGDKVEERG